MFNLSMIEKLEHSLKAKSQYIKAIKAENKKLRECVESFANCITCANGHYKDLARKTLKEIDGENE